MKKVLYLIAVAFIMCGNVLAQNSQSQIDLAKKEIYKEWQTVSDNLISINGEIPNEKLLEVDNRINKKIIEYKLSKDDMEELKYTSTMFKIVTYRRLLQKKENFKDLKTLSFIKDFTFDSKYSTMENTDINLVDAYWRLREKYENTSNYDEYYNRLISYSPRINEMLTYKNSAALKVVIPIAVEITMRYIGAEEWLFNPKIEEIIQDDLLKDKLIKYKKNCSQLRPGGIAPKFNLMDTSGNMVSSDKFKGKVMVIDVWGTWCSGCIKAMPNFIALKNKYQSEDVVFITISTEHGNTFDLWKTKLSQLNMTDMVSLYCNSYKKMLTGQDFVENYNIQGAPRYFIVDRNSKFRSVYAPYAGSKQFEEILIQTIRER